MSDKPKFDAVLSMDDPRFPEKFAEAIGAKPGETIEFVTPQFTRPKGEPGPGTPPATREDWEALRGMSKQALKECGLRPWDIRLDGTTLMLLPGEWYRAIPAGFSVVGIGAFEDPNMPAEPFVPGETDDDIRFGCLAYGVVIKCPPPSPETVERERITR